VDTEQVRTPALGRHVTIRTDGSDYQVWADTFTGLYHVPPVAIAPRTVLDLGANIGLTAAHYKAMWPDAQVVAVEMDAESAALAVENAPGVDVRQHAVAATRGTVRYVIEGVRAEAYRIHRGALHDGPPGSDAPLGHEEVPALTLPDIIRSVFPDACAEFVKMDVEGEEWPILATYPAWQDMVGTLLVELHPGDAMPDDSDILAARALLWLDVAGFDAVRHTAHPRAVWAVRRAL
jgi:FkbM family methyltransferase